VIDAGPVESEEELRQILDLQRVNLTGRLTAAEIAADGFVTVQHTLDLLKRMHAIVPSVVARTDDGLAGYALVMPVQIRPFIPVLEPMFQRLGSLGLLERRFYVMGQICVAKAWRGKGVFDLLYQAHRRHLRATFDYCVTEVAMRNTRSLRAHERVGFVVIDRYRDTTDDWALIQWDWSEPQPR